MVGGGAVFSTYAQRCREEYKRLSPHPEKWDAFVAALRNMWRSQPTFKPADLARLKIKMTVSAGDHEEVIRRDHTEQMARLIPGAILDLQRGVSHFGILQDPDQFNASLLKFLMA